MAAEAGLAAPALPAATAATAAAFMYCAWALSAATVAAWLLMSDELDEGTMPICGE